jgi:hypothetical protein
MTLRDQSSTAVSGSPQHGSGPIRGASALIASLPLLLPALVATGVSPKAHADVTTVAKDQLRIGWYSDQTTLTAGLVSGGTFVPQFAAPVDGQVYAQPLVANNNVLMATETNNIYRLDPGNGAQRWSRNLGTPWNPADLWCADATPSIGITGTPVVDKSSSTMYLPKKTYVAPTAPPRGTPTPSTSPPGARNRVSRYKFKAQHPATRPRRSTRPSR